MMNRTKTPARAALAIAILCAASGATGQTFARYSVTGWNLSRDRGLDDAQAGDLIRIAMRVEHDAFSYAGGKVEFLSDGVDRDDMRIWEERHDLWEPWQVGRHDILRILVSDAPEFSARPFNEIVVGFPDGTITDVNNDFIDLASTPPGLGGLSGGFPIDSGEDVFRIEYVYDGGMDLWNAGHSGRARLWRDDSDINGIEVLAFSGDTLVVSPAPGVLVVLAIGGVLGLRRRRC